MSCEVEELHNIAVSIMQIPSIDVVMDNSLETAMTDFKRIYVTIQLVPPELRKYRRVVSRVLDGEVAHEAGHIVITMPVKEREKRWILTRRYPTLANIVHQTIEDKRVNYYILSRYRFDFAFRLQLLADVSNRLWLDTLHAEVAKERGTSPDNLMKPESYFMEQRLIALASLKGLWGIDVEKEFQLTQRQIAFINASVKIFDESRFDKMVMSVINRHQQLYELWEKHVEATSEQAEKNVPKGMGGQLRLISGRATQKALAKMEKKLKADEDRADEEAKREGRKRGDKDSKGMAAGSGTGLNIPTPTPDEDEYINITTRNREHIERLLNLLKRLAMPKTETQRHQKQGRFMTEVLGKAFASSQSHVVENIYSRKVERLERATACIGLLVDMSGSMDIEDAKDSLTVISEMCGRWLRDEDFAILDFGSEYQKIKAFVEPYHTTRIRIGGLTCLGGTVLLNPLEELYHMMKAQHDHRRKILTIVSDFSVDKPEECKKLIKTIEEDDISVVGLGIDSSNDRMVHEFCKNGKYIGSIKELPEAVFDLYKAVAL